MALCRTLVGRVSCCDMARCLSVALSCGRAECGGVGERGCRARGGHDAL